MTNGKNNNLIWLLAGVGVGAAVAILYAPKSGRETRKDIVDGVQKGYDYVAATGRDAREQISNLIDQGKAAVGTTIDSAVNRSRELVGRKKDQISSAVDAGRQAIHKATAP